jgi:hypothetical protein
MADLNRPTKMWETYQQIRGGSILNISINQFLMAGKMEPNKYSSRKYKSQVGNTKEV